MSFSTDVKEELSKEYTNARHCQIAEIAAILSMCGHISIDEKEQFRIRIYTENVYVARKYFTLLRKSFNIRADVSLRQNVNKSYVYTIVVKNHADSLRVLQGTKLLTPGGEISEDLSLVSNQVVQQDCCRRAFLRGAFLSTGSISDPEKFYHYEISCAVEKKALQIQALLQKFALDAKIILRKKNFVVYLKEGSQIVDVLNIMGAHIALMEMENIRILKDIRNSVNRKLNCEMANINKTVSAANKQVADIRYLAQKIGLDALPDNLRAMAELRLEYPDASLIELGNMLVPAVGKSGVNHRLRRLTNMAKDLREQEE